MFNTIIGEEASFAYDTRPHGICSVGYHFPGITPFDQNFDVFSELEILFVIFLCIYILSTDLFKLLSGHMIYSR